MHDPVIVDRKTLLAAIFMYVRHTLSKPEAYGTPLAHIAVTVAEQIADWLDSEMSLENGCFASGIDVDDFMREHDLESLADMIDD